MLNNSEHETSILLPVHSCMYLKAGDNIWIVLNSRPSQLFSKEDETNRTPVHSYVYLRAGDNK
jgi:hypothetical protein